ncbi:unnamed protein product [Rotaria magnacalcarata]|uniref:Ubiquitin-like protease family profile domain-containing protein n=1 Tax=Rotaria magnacalcarata TaxID=392030 RepID=A0A815MFU2_9BILA|nr:unnamed protein product [Rotaria magnacalcarata]
MPLSWDATGGYGFFKPFPKSPIIHSDRAPVFLLANIQIFNQGKIMDRYIERCWRILQRTATKRDLEITIVHACLGHFMKNKDDNITHDIGSEEESIFHLQSSLNELFTTIKQLDYDIVLCPINQKQHWYLIVLDLETKLILQFDSLRTHDLPRAQNMNRLILHLNAQNF